MLIRIFNVPDFLYYSNSISLPNNGSGYGTIHGMGSGVDDLYTDTRLFAYSGDALRKGGGNGDGRFHGYDFNQGSKGWHHLA